jgi:hypothetical protein
MPADPAPSPGTAPVLLAAAPATEAAPAAEPPPAQPAPQPGAPVVAASPPPAQVAATHAATPDMMSSSVGWNPAEPPAPRAARPAPRVASRPVMIAHLHAPAITVPPLNHLPIAAIAPPRIRLPALAAFHGKPDPAHGHVGPAPLLHLAMARQPARHDVTLAEFMAQIDVAKPASHRSAPPHHAGQGRSDPPHNLSLPPPAPETLVARSEPPHQAEAPAASPDRAPPAQRQEQAAVEQPRYQPPAYRYPPYQMPYGSPYSPVYRSPWGPYAWSSRPYYPQQPQPGYAYQ